MTTVNSVTVPDTYHNARLDKALSALLPEFSRSRLVQLIRDGQVLAGDVVLADPSRKVAAGAVLTVRVPPAEPSELVPEAIALSIVYEDADLLVIDKPAGMTVHPAPGAREGTLVHALLAHCGETLSGIGGVERPGIVHRLDKDTSGLMVVAKHDVAHRALSAQLSDRTLSREYLAVAWGIPNPASGTYTGNLGRSTRDRKKMAVLAGGGKPAVTHYRVKQVLAEGKASLVAAKLETGRTHQIRVHFAHHGHPLIGDPLYGRKRQDVAFARQALHAAAIGFRHPGSGDMLRFIAPPPEDLRNLVVALGGSIIIDAQGKVY